MFEEFYKEYAKEEQEVIVLIREILGSMPCGDCWAASALSLGMVFCTTGEADIREGRLRWPINQGEEQSEKGYKKFGEMQICRLKVRKILDECVPNYTTPEKFNTWTVIEVLDTSASCPELQAVIDEYNKPVIIEDDVLGTLKLNRDYGTFETEILWNGKKISLMLEVDKENKSSWTRARNAAKKMLAEQETWDKAMREFAAQKLTSLANDWQADDEEKKNAKPITEKEFAKRTSLSELSISSGGSFSAFFDDDDMFWGHTVEVCGSVKKGVTSADIAG